MVVTQSIQTLKQRLSDLGYYSGKIDGVDDDDFGRAMTKFKAAHGYWARPYAGPITLALLFSSSAKSAPVNIDEFPPWYVLALSKRGLHERHDNSELKSWLRSDGFSIGDPAKIPWCGDLVETAIHKTLPREKRLDNPYLARNWLDFGIPCDVVVGAICVFWRISKTATSGHVGFVAGQDPKYVHVLGGNQSDSVTIARLDATRLLGCRWPATYPIGTRKVALSAVGTVSHNEI